jgi:hypothetical protein
MRMSWVALTGFAIFGSACRPADAPIELAEQPIVAGTPDTGDPAIMEVLASRGNAGSRCTATLISPRLLLLADHCFVETPGFTYQVFPGNNDGGNGSARGMLPIKTILQDPQYVTPRRGDDFAIVVLETPMTARPVPLNRAPLDQAIGKTVRYVGYGLTTPNDPGSGGVKRQNTAPLATVSPILLSLAPNAHGACNGDSGGPLLLDDGGGESIIGVASFVVNPPCQRDSFYQRLDTQLAWIDEQIRKYDPPGGAAPADAGLGDAGSANTPDARPVEDAVVPAGDDVRGAEVDAASGKGSRSPDAAGVAPQPNVDAQSEPPTAGATHDTAGGCAVARSAGRPGTAEIAALLLGLLLLRRRRRSPRH